MGLLSLLREVCQSGNLWVTFITGGPVVDVAAEPDVVF
jgi:hypothetical protein